MHVHLFTKEILNGMRGIFASVCRYSEFERMAFDGEDDSVHVNLNYLPEVSVSSLVNTLKGVSSHMIRRKR
ncbi:MAG: hypothetical protein GAK33_04974 [Burkholderia lata]|uniref:Transposase IS200-like domain-containing protein n=1 Tax=Burkholderia lata (strain ATCC 17760 / DSM 23089 / LMG 22485 / NCIMB 9086 / R18194 / 383) TaxID=482957 RepID=A0A833UJ91_BURL3|nr:MAG: hypothetical protein GAK33_04974 [Burkholderia lata]